MGKFDFSSWAKVHKTRLCQPEKFARLFDAPVRILQDGKTLIL